jgi:hypothetical protein
MPFEHKRLVAKMKVKKVKKRKGMDFIHPRKMTTISDKKQTRVKRAIA